MLHLSDRIKISLAIVIFCID